MAVIAIQTPGVSGAVVTFAAATAGDGDTFVNNGNTFLRVNNGGGAPITVTVVATIACNQGSLHNGGGSVTNGTEETFGPFPQNRFGPTTTVTYSAVTSVTVAAVSPP